MLRLMRLPGRLLMRLRTRRSCSRVHTSARSPVGTSRSQNGDRARLSLRSERAVHSVVKMLHRKLPYPNSGIDHATAQGPPTVGTFQAMP
jgi:hypothetical protein